MKVFSWTILPCFLLVVAFTLVVSPTRATTGDDGQMFGYASYLFVDETISVAWFDNNVTFDRVVAVPALPGTGSGSIHWEVCCGDDPYEECGSCTTPCVGQALQPDMCKLSPSVGNVAPSLCTLYVLEDTDCVTQPRGVNVQAHYTAF